MQFKLTTQPDAFNPVTGDLHLTDGQLTLIGDPAGPVEDFKQAVMQDVRGALQMFRGEWFLDLNEGVPYFEKIFVKAPDVAVIKSIYRQVILKCNHVSSLVSIDVAVDKATRTGTVSFVATLTTGDTLDTATMPFPLVVQF